MAQIINITSEALQSTIRRLLPSQQGFGEDLQATNVVTPIIDLTPTAEGSTVPSYLQRALAFGSQTVFSAENNSSTLANSPGFWQLYGVSNIEQPSSSTHTSQFSLTDGLSTKIIWRHLMAPGSAGNGDSLAFDVIVFLRAGDSVTVSSSSSNGNIAGTYRQVADVNGNLVNPAGFTIE